VVPATEQRIGGATRKEWIDRFEKARAEVEVAETQLAEAQGELETLASNTESWQVSAPGVQSATAETGPLSFGLRQEIRRSREELERAQLALSELRIEANLSGVPAEWIGDDGPPAPPAP
jgi:multidrug efflux pump subunit AcrA (membrane-fusion protein)